MINWGYIDRTFPLMGQALRNFIEVEKLPSGKNIEDNEVIRKFIESHGLNSLSWNDSFKLIEAKLSEASKYPQPTTYIRKYYLHRQVKKAGFSMELEKCHKTINVLPAQIEEAKENKYVSELQQQHNYGVQILNPMTNSDIQ